MTNNEILTQAQTVLRDLTNLDAAARERKVEVGRLKGAEAEDEWEKWFALCDLIGAARTVLNGAVRAVEDLC